MKELESGIYAFIYKNEYAYVGQSINIEKRLVQHKRDIEKKRHSVLVGFEDYDIADFEFKKLCSCSGDDLNANEIRYFDEYAKNYEMLNINQCGIQGNPNYSVEFKENKFPSLSYKNGSFFVGNSEISQCGKLHCLTDLCNYVNENSNCKTAPSAVINSVRFCERLSATIGIKIESNRRTVDQLKSIGIYKTVGRGVDRRVYCDYNVFITVAYDLCPQLGAAVVMFVVDNSTLGTPTIK